MHPLLPVQAAFVSSLRARHDRGQRCGKLRDLGLAVSNGRSKRASSRIIATAHRLQHMAGPDLARRAGRTSRKRNAGEVEGDLRRLRLHAGNGKEGGVRQPFGVPAPKISASGASQQGSVSIRSRLLRTASMPSRRASASSPRRRSRRSRRGSRCRRGGPSPGRRRVPAAPASSGRPWRRSAPAPCGPPILCDERMR